MFGDTATAVPYGRIGARRTTDMPLAITGAPGQILQGNANLETSS
ncbi:predicted protein [Streptomyces albidoflavus]|nr:predicted protein [Streptomyces albidoflavus]